MEWIQKIQKSFASNLVLYTNHAKFEMENEEFGRILDKEIFESVINGEVIEKYLTDKPYPSVLIFGETNIGRPLHTVCSYNKDEETTIIITVYHPDPDLWIDYKRRRS